MRLIIPVFVLLLIMPMALADHIVVQPNDGGVYSSDEWVNLEIDCSESIVAIQLVSESDNILVASERVGDSGSYIKPLSLADGKYSLYVWCERTEIISFCVGDSCLISEEGDSEEPPGDEGDTGESSSDGSEEGDSEEPPGDVSSTDTSVDTIPTRSSGGGRGSSCRDEWSCGVWSSCRRNLETNEIEQTRSCVKTNSCRRDYNKPAEVQSCTTCKESWVCGAWSQCSKGWSERTCYDENHCATSIFRPKLEKTCSEEKNVANPIVAKSSEKIPPKSAVDSEITNKVEPEVKQVVAAGAWEKFSTTMKKAWNNHAALILAIPLLLAAIIIVLLFVIKYINQHKPAANSDQLESYVRNELAAGMSKDLIRSNLESSGWSDKEITSALDSTPLPVQESIQNPPNKGIAYGV